MLVSLYHVKICNTDMTADSCAAYLMAAITEGPRHEILFSVCEYKSHFKRLRLDLKFCMALLCEVVSHKLLQCL